MDFDELDNRYVLKSIRVNDQDAQYQASDSPIDGTAVLSIVITVVSLLDRMVSQMETKTPMRMDGRILPQMLGRPERPQPLTGRGLSLAL